MSKQSKPVTIFLDENEHVLILDHGCNVFMKIKVSSAREIYEKNYKNILNSYMIFNIDCCNGFNLGKTNKTLKRFSYSSRDIPYLWKMCPKEVKNEYEQVFIGFKDLKPKVKKFISCNPQETNTTNTSERSVRLNFDNQHNLPPNLVNSEEFSPSANLISQSESSDVNNLFNYVEENGIIPSLDFGYYPEYSLSTDLLYNNTFNTLDASQYENSNEPDEPNEQDEPDEQSHNSDFC